MLEISKAIRFEIRTYPSGITKKVYIFKCIACEKEMAKTTYYAKKSTGYCSSCSAIKTHTKELNVSDKKMCKVCANEYPISHFNKREKHYRNECKACVNLKRVFNISVNEYNNILLNQNNKCAICESNFSHNHQNGNKAKLAVDHCHKTGIIRGLLCGACNMGLGLFKDNIDLLEKAKIYLQDRGHPGQDKKQES